jgi:hypothetical protein
MIKGKIVSMASAAFFPGRKDETVISEFLYEGSNVRSS